MIFAAARQWQNDLECPPLCSGHFQRKEYFKFRDSETPAGVSESHFHERSRKGKRQRDCFRRKQALQMSFTSATPPVKTQSRAARRLPDFALIQIIFPLYCRASGTSFPVQPEHHCSAYHFAPQTSLRSTYSHSFSGYWPSAVLRAMASTTKGLSSR